MEQDPLIFSGTANRPLAVEIAANLNMRLANAMVEDRKSVV